MKKTFTLLLTLFPILVSAQSFWNTVMDDGSRNISSIMDMGLYRDSLVLVNGYISEANCPYHQLNAYGLDGERKWSTSYYHNVLYCAQDYIYTAGEAGECGIRQLAIAKFDRNGHNIFFIQYPEYFDYEYHFFPNSIDVVDDGTILIASSHSVIKTDTKGSYIEEYEVELPSGINAAIAITPEEYLISTRNNLYKTNSSFDIQSSIEFTSSIKKVISRDEVIYVLLDFDLIRLDTDLNIIDTIVSDDHGLADMNFFKDDLYVRTAWQKDMEIIHIANNEIVNKLTFPHLVNNPLFVVAKDNNYIFAGNSFMRQMGVYGFLVEDEQIADISLPDIELADFDISNVSISDDGDYNYPQVYSFDVELTVRNNGEEAITSFALYIWLYGGYNCMQNYLYQNFSDIKILPGETYNFKVKRLRQYGLENNTLCFKCMAPNSELELDVENNTLCKTFDITGIDTPRQLSGVKVYPNPITDYLVIENPGAEIKSIKLMDITGKVIINKLTSGDNIRIETDNLKPGVYILKTDTDLVKMLIKN